MWIISSIRILISPVASGKFNRRISTAKVANAILQMRITLTVLVLIFLMKNVKANSSDSVISTVPRISITTIPVRLIFRDINLGVAIRINDSQTFETRLGWVHDNKYLHRMLYEPAFTSTEMNYRGPSVYFQWNKWKTARSGKSFYFGFIAGYRYLFYTDKTMWMGGFGGSSYGEELLLSQWRNDIFLLGSMGLKTSKNSTGEVSVGIRVNYTHTNVVDTKFHPVFVVAEEYEEYKRNSINGSPYSEGWGILPVIRFTSRIGWFNW